MPSLHISHTSHHEMHPLYMQINKCFPEILNCMAILNAPAFFSFSWRIIKKILDPRTAAKIQIFSNEQQGLNWMYDKIDKDQIISDYGGKGPSFSAVMQAAGGDIISKRRIVELLSLNRGSSKSKYFELSDDETAEFTVYTRSLYGCRIKVLKDGGVVKEADVNRGASENVGDSEPYRVNIASALKGPGEYKFVVECKASDGNDRDHFLMIGKVN